MKICSHNRLAGCVPAAALVLASTLWLQADPIIFTRPAIAIVTPPRETDNLPQARGKEIDFSGAQQMPVLPQMIQRQQPRTRDQDEEENVHWLLKDPNKLPGVYGKDPLKPVPMFTGNNPLSRPWETAKAEKKEEAPSLSPITRFDWNERDARDSRNPLDPDEETRRSQFSPKGERDVERDYRSTFSFRPENRQDKEEDRREKPDSTSSYDSFLARPRQEPKLSEYFEKAGSLRDLLNPRANSSVKQPGSLEPVATFDPPRPAASPPASATTTARSPLISRAPMDPSQAFKERQSRSGKIAFEDPGTKYSPQDPSKPVVPKSEPAFQTPLMRQPIQREIPSRKF